ncbi:hypothetical protein HWV62_43922 [Athelia sp. TMB]|nr:hypothetical protein HWV62_43922 [Athelia sp. TMB]
MYMFTNLSALFVFTTLAFAASVPQARVDDRVEVKIPKNDTLKSLCKAWTKECDESGHLSHCVSLIIINGAIFSHRLARHDGTPGGECVKGYAGPGTASVLCYAQVGPTATDFTEQVVKKLKLKPASD